MTCINLLYQEYLQKLQKKSWLVDIDCRDSYVQMKVLANREDINPYPYKELGALN